MIVKLYNRSTRLALLVGALDTAIVFSYLTPLPVPVWYAALILAKLAVVAFDLRHPGPIFQRNAPLLGLTLIMAASSFLHFEAGRTYDQSIGHLAFVIQAGLTLYVLRPETVAAYCRSAATMILAAMVVYLALAATGHIDHVYGRYQFFGGSHPNLGSEIIAVGTVAAAASFNRRNFFVFIGLAIIAVAMMQGRAALVTCLLVAMVRAAAAIGELPPRTRRISTALLLVAGPTILAMVALPLIENLNSALMLDDEHRGIGTGFVGRDERWLGAWRLFLDAPLMGNGADVFADRGMHGAHSFPLYALACYGTLGAVFLGMIGRRIILVALDNRWLGAAWLSLLVMLVLNDRFLNLNPYPFLAITMLCAFYGAAERRLILRSGAVLSPARG